MLQQDDLRRDRVVSCGAPSSGGRHLRSAGDSGQELIQGLFRPSQRAVQKVTEVGLNDLELALRHRDGRRKIVDNARVGERDCLGTNWPRTVGVSPASSRHRGLPSGPGDFVTSPGNRIGSVASVQIEFPPHFNAPGFRPRAFSGPARWGLVSKAGGAQAEAAPETGVVSCETC
jgi:hypothetical protein